MEFSQKALATEAPSTSSKKIDTGRGQENVPWSGSLIYARERSVNSRKGVNPMCASLMSKKSDIRTS